MKLIVGFFFLTGKTFIQSGQLVIHRRTHTGELFVRSLKINYRAGIREHGVSGKGSYFRAQKKKTEQFEY